MADSRTTRITVPLDGGNAGEQLERLARGAGRAAEASEKLGRSSDRQAEDVSKGFEKVFSGARVAIEGAAAGAVRALGQQGAGAQDAFNGGVRQLQGSLPALGAALGAPGGPLGVAAGGVLGSLGAAGLERAFGPEARARDEAINETTDLLRSAAAQGVAIEPESIRELLRLGFLDAMRQIKLEGDVRRVSNERGLFGGG